MIAGIVLFQINSSGPLFHVAYRVAGDIQMEITKCNFACTCPETNGFLFAVSRVKLATGRPAIRRSALNFALGFACGFHMRIAPAAAYDNGKPIRLMCTFDNNKRNV